MIETVVCRKSVGCHCGRGNGLMVKKDVNRDSHITSSPILQSSFFKGVRCLILASSQRKLRGNIEFL